MEQTWARLGDAFQHARAARDPKLTQDDAAQALGVSRATVQNMERGKGTTKVTPTMRAYAQLLGWTPGSIEAVLEGGEPSYTSDAAAAIGAVPETGLPLRIVHELERPGELVDTAVIPLTDDADMVVVVKGRQTATREQLLAALEAWRRAEPQLQSLDDDEEPAGA
ncbi:helix-turn-helix transcriptional regulator [Streptomyces sp. SCSIO ZS0520]|uniref:helix-turn-helix transcriptional regulator n=1 Tax=Streptomyces sp. SCSIO ZS0520 TaxID=2892996 RepID=UPI0021D9C31D|nr:helix-turn-helix transcriptional regulator [Streptomyces sp. SCSIO ZS0520]